MELPAAERIVLAIDTPYEEEADRLARIAQEAGARFVKFGLELSTATSWRTCADIAAWHDLEWIADAKFDDIPNTVAGAIRAMRKLRHPPFAITMHTTADIKAMYAAQMEAEETKLFGVTILTSIDTSAAQRIYRVPVAQKVLELAYDASDAGIAGIVCSPLEVGMIKADPSLDLLTLVPGSRSAAAEQADQSRTATPAATIAAGADLLVVGRQISRALNPLRAFNAVVTEIETVALDK